MRRLGTFIIKYKYLFILNSFVIFFISMLSPFAKVDIKIAVFSKKINTDQTRYFVKNELNELGFISEKQTSISNFKYANNFKLNFSNQISLIDSLLILINNYFPTSRFERGCGYYSDDLLNNLKWVKSGEGCCSDYSQIFIAYCNNNGILAREISNLNHTFIEVYDYLNKRWIWFDPTYSLVAKSLQGEFLSTLDIQNYQFANKKYFYYKLSLDTLNNREKLTKFYAYPESYGGKHAFSVLLITNGNNVIEVSRFTQSLRYLPRPIVQLSLYYLNIIPGYIVYDPENEYWPKIQKIRILIICFFIIVFSINIAVLKNIRNK